MRSTIVAATSIRASGIGLAATLALAALLAACGGGGGSASGSCAEVAGVWNFVEKADSTACGSGADTSEQHYFISQSGCSLTISGHYVRLAGLLNGDRFSGTGSYGVSGGTVITTTMSLTFAADGKTVSGASWRTYSGGTNCAETTQIEATQIEPMQPVHVFSTIPVRDAQAVPITSQVVIEFSEMIRYPYAGKFTLTAGGAAVDGWLDSTEGYALTFTPRELLRYATTYTVSVGAGIEFESGELLPADYTWTFTTVSPPEHDYWVRIPAEGAPAGTSKRTMIWTGNALVVWGGGVNTGARYDPVANTWSPTSTWNAPAARTEHTAVWTAGASYPVMIVWGGFDNSRLNTGGRYDPMRDSWSPMTTSATLEGDPTVTTVPAEFDHVAVWAESLARMLVWGGFGSDRSEVWSYNPASDTWTGVKGSGTPPEAFLGASVVWTGKELIVWGGGVNTGSRYDPSTKIWTPIPPDGAPSPRSDHSAVWTGSRMIVWGGRSSGGDLLDDGASYDPESGSWTALPPSDLGARWDHGAVWTGSEMVVWGGTSDPAKPSGERYDPATNAWKALPTWNEPKAGLGSMVIWNGTDVIVWQGEWPPDGGLYRP